MSVLSLEILRQIFNAISEEIRAQKEKKSEVNLAEIKIKT